MNVVMVRDKRLRRPTISIWESSNLSKKIPIPRETPLCPMPTIKFGRSGDYKVRLRYITNAVGQVTTLNWLTQMT